MEESTTRAVYTRAQLKARLQEPGFLRTLGEALRAHHADVGINDFWDITRFLDWLYLQTGQNPDAARLLINSITGDGLETPECYLASPDGERILGSCEGTVTGISLYAHDYSYVCAKHRTYAEKHKARIEASL